jgi:hypothetical protein
MIGIMNNYRGHSTLLLLQSIVNALCKDHADLSFTQEAIDKIHSLSMTVTTLDGMHLIRALPFVNSTSTHQCGWL